MGLFYYLFPVDGSPGQGDVFAAASGNPYPVNPGAAGEVLFLGSSHQAVPRAGRGEVVYGDCQGHGRIAVGVAGQAQGGVSQGKDGTPMNDTVEVDHIFSQLQGHPGIAGGQLQEFNAQGPGESISRKLFFDSLEGIHYFILSQTYCLALFQVPSGRQAMIK
ncbi:membrane GTPase LepA [Moorella thermoacetica Y72]|uniref:Membrane GTPase LepA n=1 Tax=Moorella thermoacetica Y72 TaxID=1325331 RepID=A0A0S6UDS1_NEOTH|nr:membrane GTPase LepA [Moorella thermoacetica Y72]